MRLIELTELDGGDVLINPENICSVNRPLSFDDPTAGGVVKMVNGDRYAVKQSRAEIRQLADCP